jgi:hypothetical protein
MGDFNLPLPESAGNQRKAETEVKESLPQPQQQQQDQSQGKWQGASWHQNTSAASTSYAPYPLQYSQQPPSQQYKRPSPQQKEQPQDGDEPVNIDGFQNLENSSSSFLQNVPYYNQMSLGGSVPNRDELLTKLNYMIHILEEQQDQKTGHVTEEVVLYSFLGIFIIFVIDSFARAGKYVR